MWAVPHVGKVRYPAHVIVVDGQSNERLILDGGWLEKQRGAQPVTRTPASSFRGAQWKDLERRVKLFGREKEQLVQVTLTFEGGPFVGLITDAAKRPELEAIVAGLEAARSA
ncbi:hypothetical protein GCM10010170_107340 [Dactylosporangium salmoneum]|uniref:Uncharacterized protein n=1 Tax=Dactylosporangium salmoneum TaxID=53361 RepID=A0ABN3I375_9ACTN